VLIQWAYRSIRLRTPNFEQLLQSPLHDSWHGTVSVLPRRAGVSVL